MNLPEPSKAVEILSQAERIQMVWEAVEANKLIKQGYVLVGVSPVNDTEFPFAYVLIEPVKPAKFHT